MEHTALITDATCNLGYEFSKILAKDGYNLFLVSQDIEKARNYALEIEEKYAVRTKVFPIDLFQTDSAQKIYKSIRINSIDIEILVNNAEYTFVEEFCNLDDSHKNDILNINLNFMLKLTNCIVKDMISKKRGKILNFAPLRSFLPNPKEAIFGASKAFVLSFSESLAKELREEGIQVSVLCNGPIQDEEYKISDRNFFNFKEIMEQPVSLEFIAKETYQKFKNGENIIVPGFLHEIMVFPFRFSPGWFIKKFISFLYKPALNGRSSVKKAISLFL